MLHQNSIRFHAGGAVTLGSDPKSEYQESLLKVKAIIDALKREKSDCYY